MDKASPEGEAPVVPAPDASETGRKLPDVPGAGKSSRPSGEAAKCGAGLFFAIPS